MKGIPPQLAGFCLDCFLLARHAPPGRLGPPDGRAWERAVSSLLWRPGVYRRQHAGTIGLFGSGSASGAGHEFDGAGHGPVTGIWVEAKARSAVDKSDVAVFDLKCADLYKSAVRHTPDATRSAMWWPLFVSSEPVGDPVRRLCMTLGIVLCDPQRMPLPVLLRAAANPEADMHLPEAMLGEAVRLFEGPCRSMQERWTISDGGRKLTLDLSAEPGPGTLGDAIYVQDELTGDVLDYFDLEAPGRLERRADELVRRLLARVVSA